MVLDPDLKDVSSQALCIWNSLFNQEHPGPGDMGAVPKSIDNHLSRIVML